MEASKQLRVVLRWWWLLVAAALAGGAIAYAASSLMTQTYQSTTTLLVSQQENPNGMQRGDIETSQMLAESFSQVITVRPLLEQVIAEANLDLSVSELRERIDVEHADSSQLMRITVEASDPGAASEIANTVAAVFIQSEEVQLANRAGVVSILEPAEVPAAPTSPRPALNASLGALMGLLVAGMLVTLYDARDDRIRSRQDLEDGPIGLPLLGQLRDFGRTPIPEQRLRTALYPRSAAAEEYRAARTNLGIALEPDDYGQFGRKVVLFTSPSAGEGKSTTIGNLAVMFGSAGYRVLLIDADLHRPSLHEMFGAGNTEGLSTMLSSGADSVTQPTRYSNISLIAAGPYSPSVSEVLGSAWIRTVLRHLRNEYDLILVDSPPVSQHADALALATLSDVVVMVARAGRTRASVLQSAVDDLAVARRPVAGVLLNRSRPSIFSRSMLRREPSTSEAPGERRMEGAWASVTADRSWFPPAHAGERLSSLVRREPTVTRNASRRWLAPLHGEHDADDDRGIESAETGSRGGEATAGGRQ